MNRQFLLTLSTSLLILESNLFIKEGQFCQLIQPYSKKTKVQLNSRQETLPVTGRPHDRKPAGSYAKPMP